VAYLLAGTDTAVYNDLYWQHTAFVWGGPKLMKKFHDEGSISAEQLEGWTMIADGGRKLDGKTNAGMAEIAIGNLILFKTEQRDVLQKVVWDDVALAINSGKRLPVVGVGA